MAHTVHDLHPHTPTVCPHCSQPLDDFLAKSCDTTDGDPIGPEAPHGNGPR